MAPKPTDIMRDLSDVDVTFHDGETKTYRITASPKIGPYLAEQAGQTGVLVLYDDTISRGIQMENIREYAIRPVTLAQYQRETDEALAAALN